MAGIAGQDGVLRVGTVTAAAVVLATGGFGQAYATTTNPAGLTGDGLALAARAGAELRDVEFVQFHPTVLWQDGARGQCPLITEALRGAGAVLVDAAGRRSWPAAIRSATWRPRDVVAAAMQQRMQGGRSADDGPDDHLWLDATTVGRAVLDRDFPTVVRLCRARGIDPAAEPIPVAPGAHYACGGIRAGLDGRTSRPRAVRGGGGRLDRGARGQPAGLQLPDRGADHRTAHRGTAGAGAAGAAGPAAAASGRPGDEPRRPAGPGRGHVPARRGGP